MNDPPRLVLAHGTDRRDRDGAWWPHSRHLAIEIVSLFAALPSEVGLLSRVYYCPVDWDDAPVAVPVTGRHGQLRLGHLPVQDIRRVVLLMLDGQRHTLMLIPSSTDRATALRYLQPFRGTPPLRPTRRPGSCSGD